MRSSDGEGARKFQADQSTADRTQELDAAAPPAVGERIAAGGLGGQYKIAATVVLGLLHGLEAVRVADPSAGAVDDFVVVTDREVHAVQVKWPTYPGQFTLDSICKVDRHGRGLVRDLAEGWTRLRKREALDGRERCVLVHLATRDWPSQSKEVKRLKGCPQPHAAAFFQHGLEPVQDALRRGEPAPAHLLASWAAGFASLHEASGLPDISSFHRFLTDLYIDVGVSDSPTVLAGLPGQTARLQLDVQRLAEYFFSVVAGLVDDGDNIKIPTERLLTALNWQHRAGFRSPHRFPVPVTYSPNVEVTEMLTEMVRQHTQGYVLLEGVPGSGKSTLITATNFPVDRIIRYYAYVPDSPDRASSRGEAESFIADVCDALGGAGLPVVAMGGNLSAMRERLTDALDAAGRNWAERGDRTMIVVDGLDHIVREQNPVRSLLDELPHPEHVPDGVLFVLGSQTSEILSPAIRAHLADTRTVRMRPLDARAVLSVADGMGVGRWLYPGQRDRLAAVTEGHPLALTYLLNSLAEARNDILALEADSAETSTEDAEEEAHVGRQPRALQRAIDELLGTASLYGADVQLRYLGYWEQVAGHHEVQRILGVVARLRRPLLLPWLREWCDADAVARFAATAAPLFDRDGDEWHFFHNSFRRFLEHRTATATTTGPVDDALDATFHASIADACQLLAERWPQFGDDELGHRAMAGQDERVLTAAHPALFASQLDRLRPQAEVTADIRLALEAAARQTDGIATGRLTLALMEAAQREIALPEDELVWAIIRFASLEDARRHLLDGRTLRTTPVLALRAAARYAAAGHGFDARQLFIAAGSLRVLTSTEGFASQSHGSRSLDETVQAWAVAAASLLAPDDALAQIDRALRHVEGAHSPGLPQTEPRTNPVEPDDHALADGTADSEVNAPYDASAIYRRTALGSLLAAWEVDQQHHAVTACLQRLWDLDWRQATLSEIEWAERIWEHGRVPDARTIANRIVVRLSGTTDTGIPPEVVTRLPPIIRVRLAELLIRVDSSTERARLLVPSDETLPDRDHDQNPPWINSYRLHRLRHLLGIARHPEQLITAPREAHQSGSVRFGRALLGLAELDAEVLRHQLFGGPPVTNLLDRAKQLLGLYEVSPRQTSNWTQWYKITEFSDRYFTRIADLVFRADPAVIAPLGGYLRQRFEAAPGWSFYRRRPAVAALAKAGADVSWVREQLAELERMVQSGHAGPSPAERAEAWVALATAHDAAGDAEAAKRSVHQAARAGTGLGVHDDDDQIRAWAAWLHQVVMSASDRAGAAEAITRFALRLHRYAEVDSGSQFPDAAASIIRTAWHVDPQWAVQLGDWALEQGMLGLPDVLAGHLTAAAENFHLPSTVVAEAIANLLLPVQGYPPEAMWQALLRRAQDPAEVINVVAEESRKWLNTGNRAQHFEQVQDALTETSQAGALGETDWRTAFGLLQTRSAEESSSYDPWARGELLIDGEPWSARRVRHAAVDGAALIDLLGRSSPMPASSAPAYNAFPWHQLLQELLPTTDVQRLRRIAALLEPHQVAENALLVVARHLATLGDKIRARAVARHALEPRLDQKLEIGGWSSGWGDLTRRHLWQLLVELGEPDARRDALRDLTRTMRSNRINAARIATDLYPIMGIINGEAGALELWPEIETYLDRIAPIDETARIPIVSPASSSNQSLERRSAIAFSTLTTMFLGHPARPLDFGARHLVATVLMRAGGESVADMLSSEYAAVLAGHLTQGGWPAEAAASVLAVSFEDKAPSPVPMSSDREFCGHIDPLVRMALHDAIAAAVNSPDLIISDLSRRAASLHGLVVAPPASQALPASYLLTAPPLYTADRPTVDPRTGAVLADPFDPCARIAPYDSLLKEAAHQGELDESIVVHHGAMRGGESDVIGPVLWRRWTDGGSDGLAERIESQKINTVFRPLALLTGRRGAAWVLSELMRGGMLPNPPNPESAQDAPLLSEQIGLSQPTFLLHRAESRPRQTPKPWIPENENAMERVWVGSLSEAVRHSVRDLDETGACDESDTIGAVMAAEISYWHRADRERPQEHRRRTLVPARQAVIIGSGGLIAPALRPDGTPDQVKFGVMPSIDLYQRRAWAAMQAVRSHRLKSVRAQGPWIIRGDATWSEAPFGEWLAISPWLAASLGWTLAEEGLFRWVTADGEQRAWSRSWIDHDGWTTYLSGEDYADGWQVLLSDSAIAELQGAIGAVDILAEVRRAISQPIYAARMTAPVSIRRSLSSR